MSTVAHTVSFKRGHPEDVIFEAEVRDRECWQEEVRVGQSGRYFSPHFLCMTLAICTPPSAGGGRQEHLRHIMPLAWEAQEELEPACEACSSALGACVVQFRTGPG